MIYQVDELSGLSSYVTSFLGMTLRGCLDLTSLVEAKAHYEADYSHNRYTYPVEPARLNNRLISLVSKCTLKSTGETKYVVPVFTTTTFIPNFYFEEESSALFKIIKSLPKHQQQEYYKTHSEDLNRARPFGIFYHGTDDIHYGFRLTSAQEVEDYLELEEAVGELDTIMWRN